MTLADFGLGAAGIAVSLVTFLVGYRQTIGVRQARANASNLELVDVILRRLVLDELPLNSIDLDSVRSGQSVENRIPEGALWSPEQLLNVVRSRLMKDELIGPERRARALTSVNNLQKESADVGSGELQTDPTPLWRRPRTIIILIIAVIAAALGTAFSGAFGKKTGSLGDSALVLQFVGAVVLLGGVGVALLYRAAGPLTKTLESRNPLMRELRTFPESESGREALDCLCRLSPFAVRNLYQLAFDEYQSMRRGVPVGLAGNSAQNLGMHELLEAKLIDEITPVNRRSPHWYGLTPKGRMAGRLLLPGPIGPDEFTIPDYLANYVHRDPGNA